mgnify:CR=1 FL=1
MVNDERRCNVRECQRVCTHALTVSHCRMPTYRRAGRGHLLARPVKYVQRAHPRASSASLVRRRSSFVVRRSFVVFCRRLPSFAATCRHLPSFVVVRRRSSSFVVVRRRSSSFAVVRRSFVVVCRRSSSFAAICRRSSSLVVVIRRCSRLFAVVCRRLPLFVVVCRRSPPFARLPPFVVVVCRC